MARTPGGACEQVLGLDGSPYPARRLGMSEKHAATICRRCRPHLVLTRSRGKSLDTASKALASSGSRKSGSYSHGSDLEVAHGPFADKSGLRNVRLIREAANCFCGRTAWR